MIWSFKNNSDAWALCQIAIDRELNSKLAAVYSWETIGRGSRSVPRRTPRRHVNSCNPRRRSRRRNHCSSCYRNRTRRHNNHRDRRRSRSSTDQSTDSRHRIRWLRRYAIRNVNGRRAKSRRAHPSRDDSRPRRRASRSYGSHLCGRFRGSRRSCHVCASVPSPNLWFHISPWRREGRQQALRFSICSSCSSNSPWPSFRPLTEEKTFADTICCGGVRTRDSTRILYRGRQRCRLQQFHAGAWPLLQFAFTRAVRAVSAAQQVPRTQPNPTHCGFLRTTTAARRHRYRTALPPGARLPRMPRRSARRKPRVA